jgi:light-regulated signal transduction histidine kinase (bacteriophytochrome)
LSWLKCLENHTRSAPSAGNGWFGIARAELVFLLPITVQASIHNTEHAEQLFDVFQRLHTDAEFPGTSVGLATMWRIIEHHRG